MSVTHLCHTNLASDRVPGYGLDRRDRGRWTRERRLDFGPDFGTVAAIREVTEDWAVLRDVGRWEEFARAWHDDGWMTATWLQGPYREFIAASQSAFERGVSIAHFLGGFSCEVAGDRAVAQTKVKIERRARGGGPPAHAVDGLAAAGVTARRVARGTSTLNPGTVRSPPLLKVMAASSDARYPVAPPPGGRRRAVPVNGLAPG
jgi:hypothetical protein